MRAPCLLHQADPLHCLLQQGLPRPAAIQHSTSSWAQATLVSLAALKHARERVLACPVAFDPTS